MSTYHAAVTWTRGTQEFLRQRYSRGHTWTFDEGVSIRASASPHVVRAPWHETAAVDPEEALAAALASCHMLFFLSDASRNGHVVESYADTPEALTCVLTALRDRTPGVVRWSASAGDESTNDGYVLILGGDAAIKRYWGFQDLTYEVYDAQYGELPPPAAFDTCLAAELAWERASCLFSLGLIPPFVVCDEGWSQSLL